MGQDIELRETWVEHVEHSSHSSSAERDRQALARVGKKEVMKVRCIGQTKTRS